MHRIFFFSFFLFSFFLFGQQPPLDKSINDLKTKVLIATDGEKLILMDSLCKLIGYQKEYKVDSLLQVTIDYAVELDSFNIAVSRAAQLIRYYNKTAQTDLGQNYFKKFKENPFLSKANNSLLSNFYKRGAESFYYGGDLKGTIEGYNLSYLYAEKANDSSSMLGIKRSFGELYINLGDFIMAGKALKKAEDINKTLKDSSALISIISSKALLFSRIGLYKEAKKQRDSVIVLSKKANKYVHLAAANIEANFDNRKTGNYQANIPLLEDAASYLEKSSENAKDYFGPILLNEMLYAYSRVDSVTKAKRILAQIQANPKKYKRDYAEIDHEEALAQYYYATKDFDKSLEVLLTHITSLQDSKDYYRKLNVLQTIFQNYDALGNKEKSYTFYKQYSTLRDSINNAQKANTFIYFEALYQSEKKDAEIFQQQSKISILNVENRVKLLWIVFGGLGALLSIIFFIVRHKHRMKLSVLRNQMLVNEVEHKKKDLANFALNISESQTWAGILAGKLEKVKVSKGRVRAKELNLLEIEIKNKMWIDDGAENIQDKIDVLSNAFYENLNEQFSNLTKNEIRLCSLIKLNMDSKQIAILQNISPSSVKMSRYRLRKKLFLSPEQDIYAFLQGF